MIKTALAENDNGTIFRYKKIPVNMFNFYALKKKSYKNGKSLWHLCIEIAQAPGGKKSAECVNTEHNYIKLESFSGTKIQAEKRLDAIVKEYE